MESPAAVIRSSPLRRVAAVSFVLSACAPVVVEAFEPAPERAECTGASEEDFDGDGTADCEDDCPDNAGAVTPVGPCGCSSLMDAAGCSELRAAIRNLYTFDGTGTAVVDVRSGMHGALQHQDPAIAPEELVALRGRGRLRLDGAGSYVDLPDGLISELESATLEAWLMWTGNEQWSRIFDFGSNDGAAPADGVTYLFLTPSNATNGRMRIAYSVGGPLQETRVDAASALPVESVSAPAAASHVAVVIDDSADAMLLYMNGALEGSATLPGGLAAIDDVNNWLGRSNYEIDPALSGTLLELRIYQRALSAAQIATSFAAGPGALD